MKHIGVPIGVPIGVHIGVPIGVPIINFIFTTNTTTGTDCVFRFYILALHWSQTVGVPFFLQQFAIIIIPLGIDYIYLALLVGNRQLDLNIAFGSATRIYIFWHDHATIGVPFNVSIVNCIYTTDSLCCCLLYCLVNS